MDACQSALRQHADGAVDLTSQFLPGKTPVDVRARHSGRGFFRSSIFWGVIRFAREDFRRRPSQPPGIGAIGYWVAIFRA